MGAWYTPPPLVEAIVREAVFTGARSVLDPACGDGRFLVAAALPRRVGVDIDPTVAVDPSVSFHCDDALRREWNGEQFDVVLGNPPFLSQMSTLTSRRGRSSFGGGPYADVAAEFLALALQRTRPGGRIGMVLPQSLLSARDASEIRERLDREAALRWMWWSTVPMFDAAVRVWAGVWEVGGGPAEVRRSCGPGFEDLAPMIMPRTWSGLLTGSSAGASAGPVLGDIASFSADFRDQYYGLVGAVDDEADGPPLVSSGLIDPGVCHWGRRPMRFAGRRFLAPRVDLGSLSPTMQRWATRRLVPKVLVANQTKVVEAVIDERGEWLPSVPVITCVTDDLRQVVDVLSSPATTNWLQDHVAGSGLGVGTMRLSPRLLAAVPR